MVIPDNDPLKPALYQDLVEGLQVCGLLFDEILQFIDAGNLCVSGGGINRALFALFPELEDLVGNLIIGLFVIGFFEKLFLKLLQSFVNAISGFLLSTTDHLCNVLLELCLVGGLIAKERVNCLNYHILQEELIGRTCYGGLDLSSTSDITAFVLVFPPRNDEEKYIILPYCWIPEDNMRLRVRRNHVPYDVWAAEGCLETTEGNVIHYGFIEKFIEELGTKYHIKEIAFDRWGATQMVQDLEGMGFTVVPFGQGYKDMSPPTKELMKLTLEERIAHGGHKVLRWMMDNVYVRQDPAGNIKMDKEKSTEKIDAAVATVMALDRAIRNQGSEGSVYDGRGILVF